MPAKPPPPGVRHLYGRLSRGQEMGRTIAGLEAKVKILQTALRLAAGELSTHEPNTRKHPQEVYNELLIQAADIKHSRRDRG